MCQGREKERNERNTDTPTDYDLKKIMYKTNDTIAGHDGTNEYAEPPRLIVSKEQGSKASNRNGSAEKKKSRYNN